MVLVEVFCCNSAIEARALVACSLEATDVRSFLGARAPFQAFTPAFTPYLVSVVRVP